MPVPNPAALEFLLTRRSHPARTLTPPVPTHDQLLVLLTAAARVPDHGKLEPWRFIVLDSTAMPRLAALVARRASDLGLDAEQAAKGRAQFDAGLLAVAVVASPKASEKIPEREQVLSAGAVCLALLNAALAAGWGANWLSGWPSRDRGFIAEGLGLEARESVAGLIHIGTAPAAPLPDRPRPDLTRCVTWVAG